MPEDSITHEMLLAKIDNLRENHFAHLAADVSEVKICLAEVKADVSWLKSFFWLIAGTSVGGLLTGIINLILK